MLRLLTGIRNYATGPKLKAKGPLKLIQIKPKKQFVGVINHQIVRGFILESRSPYLRKDGMTVKFFQPHYSLSPESPKAFQSASAFSASVLRIEHKDKPGLSLPKPFPLFI